MCSSRLFTFTIIVIINIAFTAGSKERSTLKLVHLIFRHGDRTNDISTLYPKDPYLNETYYPYGLGQLTNKGRKTEFLLGKRLRRRYDDFLEDVYTPNVLDAFSTQIDRTKTSLQLVLAGLFPPKHTILEWNKELNWQPIAFTSLAFADNPLLTFPHLFCPIYAKLYNEYLSSDEGCKVERKYAEVYGYLSENTGLNITSTYDLRLLLYGLATEAEWGLKLPVWTRSVYPHILEDGVIDFFVQSSATSQLKQLAAGFLLKKIINDSRLKLNGQLTPQGRKLFLYSAHEFNVAFLLSALEVYFRHSPPYGSCIMVEVHTINGVDGIKIFYEDYSGKEPKMLKVPGCSYFCPFDEFVNLLSKNIPPNDNICKEMVSDKEVEKPSEEVTRIGSDKESEKVIYKETKGILDQEMEKLA